MEITTPWEWQWPAARVFEMLYRTHCDVPAEELVEELYRREPRARFDTGG